MRRPGGRMEGTEGNCHSHLLHSRQAVEREEQRRQMQLKIQSSSKHKTSRNVVHVQMCKIQIETSHYVC